MAEEIALVASSSTPVEVSTHAGSEALVGRGGTICRVREWMRGLSSLEVPVLITGEEGTGRRAAARFLHAAGAYPTAPILEVESHRDPWPEALPLRGSLFVAGFEDQIPKHQALWKRRLSRSPGGARLLFGAGPTLAERVRVGRFDAELATQLARFELRLPPLRERAEDLAAISAALLATAGRELGRPARSFSDGALRLLARERWPGNVEELRRVVERLVAFTEADKITMRDVEAVLEDVRPTLSSLRESFQSAERERLLKHLAETGGNVTATADLMSKSRASIYRLVEKHGIALRRG